MMSVLCRCIGFALLVAAALAAHPTKAGVRGNKDGTAAKGPLQEVGGDSEPGVEESDWNATNGDFQGQGTGDKSQGKNPEHDPQLENDIKVGYCPKITCDIDVKACKRNEHEPMVDCLCCGVLPKEEDFETQPKKKLSVGEIKKAILDIIDEAEASAVYPNSDEIFRALQDDYGIDGELLEERLEKNPNILKDINDAFDGAIKRKGKADLLLVSEALSEEGRAGKNFNEALVDLGESSEEFEAAFNAFGSQEDMKRVQDAFEEKARGRVDKITKALDKGKGKGKVVEKGNGKGKFADKGNGKGKFVDEGTRKLLYVKNHTETFVQDKDSGRVLNGFPRIIEKMNELKTRLPVHANAVKRHLIEVADPCSPTECLANELTELGDEVSGLSSSVVGGLTDLQTILEGIESGYKKLELAKTISVSVHSAVVIGSFIPAPPIKGPFTTFKTLLTPIKNAIKKAYDKAYNFEQRLGRKWMESLDKVIGLLDSFVSILPTLAGATSLVATVGEAPCAEQVFSTLLGVNVFKPIESVAPHIKQHAETFKDALVSLSTALMDQFWTNLSDTIKDVLEGLQPVLDFFEPFSQLGELIHKEITIPWIAWPYAKERLGDASCKSGHYLGVTGRTCWENTPDYWHIDIPDIYSFRIQCDHPSLSTSRVLTRCWNNHHARHSVWYPSWEELRCSCGCWGCVCPSCRTCGCSCKYGSNYQRHFTGDQYCRKKCSSSPYTITGLNTCYKNSCPRYYSMTQGIEYGMYCNPQTRQINSHTAMCSQYQVDEGIVGLGVLGGCYVQCESGENDFLGWCVPNAELTISIAMINEVFQEIFEAIQDLPIVGTILGAIDKFVGAVLKPVMDKFTGFLEDLGIIPPIFPDIPDDLFPFVSFDGLQLPEMPDLSVLSDFGTNAITTMANALPDFPSEFVSCGTDVTCLMETMGLGSFSDVFTQFQEMYSGFQSLPAAVASLATHFECTQFTNHSLPIGSMLEQAGFPVSGDPCAIDIPICTGVDTSKIQDDMNAIFAVVESAIDKVIEVASRRKLQTYSNTWLNIPTTKDEWYTSLPEGKFVPIISFSAASIKGIKGGSTEGVRWSRTIFATSILINPGGQYTGSGSAYAGTEVKGGSEKPFLNARLEVSIAPFDIELGIWRKNGKLRPNLRWVPSLTINLFITRWMKNILQETVEKVKYHTTKPQLQDYPAEDDTSKFPSDLPGHSDKIWGKLVCLEGKGDSVKIKKSPTMCEPLQQARDLLEGKDPTQKIPVDCDLQDMEESLDEDLWIVKGIKGDAILFMLWYDCAKHWIFVLEKVQEKISEFDSKRQEEEDKDADKDPFRLVKRWTQTLGESIKLNTVFFLRTVMGGKFYLRAGVKFEKADSTVTDYGVLFGFDPEYKVSTGMNFGEIPLSSVWKGISNPSSLLPMGGIKHIRPGLSFVAMYFSDPLLPAPLAKNTKNETNATSGPTEGPTGGPTLPPMPGPTGALTSMPTSGPSSGPTSPPTRGPTSGLSSMLTSRPTDGPKNETLEQLPTKSEEP